MTIRAVSIQPGTMSAEDYRLAYGGLWVPATSLTARTGFLPGAVPTATLAGGLGVNIPAFRATVQGSSSTNQGAYELINNANVVVTLDAGNTQDRIDLIVAQVRNNSYDALGADDVRITFVKGTPAASPVPPVLPPSSILLATQRVQANASVGSPLTAGNLTAVTGPLTGSLTGIRPVSAAFGGVGDNGFFTGQYRDNAGQLQRWNGASWDTGLQSRLATVEAINQPGSGTSSDTTTTNARVSFNHGRSYRPTRAHAWMAEGGGNNYLFRTVSISSTAVTMHVIAAATGADAASSQGVTFDWAVWP